MVGVVRVAVGGKGVGVGDSAGTGGLGGGLGTGVAVGVGIGSGAEIEVAVGAGVGVSTRLSRWQASATLRAIRSPRITAPHRIPVLSMLRLGLSSLRETDVRVN